MKSKRDFRDVSKITSPNLNTRLWGKLISNLNNCINALSGLTLLEQFSQQGYRRILAASVRELMGLLKQKKVKPETFYAMIILYQKSIEKNWVFANHYTIV